MMTIEVRWNVRQATNTKENIVTLPVDEDTNLWTLENIGELLAENCSELVDDLVNHNFDNSRQIRIHERYSSDNGNIVSGNEVARHIKEPKKEEKKVLDIRLLRAVLKPDANNKVDFEDVVKLLANY